MSIFNGIFVLQATNNFCRKLETNRKLREEIDSLRVERQRFDNLYKRMDRDLQRLKQEIGSVIDESTSAYDSRCVGDVVTSV